jgi:hypothetical protein
MNPDKPLSPQGFEWRFREDLGETGGNRKNRGNVLKLFKFFEPASIWGIPAKLLNDLNYVLRPYPSSKAFSLGELSKRTERDVMTSSSAEKRLQITSKTDLDLAEEMRKL